MPNVGPLEIVLILIVALVIFGPKRLPELGRSAGKGIREFKKNLNEVEGAVTGALDSGRADARPEAVRTGLLDSCLSRPRMAVSQ